jgi:RNA polymerase sigma-70 factor (ECF subfamily)
MAALRKRFAWYSSASYALVPCDAKPMPSRLVTLDEGPRQQRVARWSTVADQDELNEMALRYGPALARTAFRMTGDSDDAEDLVQETYLRALQGLQAFDGAKPRAWLFSILHHTHASHLRHAAAAARQSRAPVTATATESVEDTVTASALSEEIEAALATLPRPSREAIVLADINGLSCEEIAARMGCPVGTVMSRLYRGRQRVAASLLTSPALTSRD